MTPEEKRQGLTYQQVKAIMRQQNPEQVEALIFTVYTPYMRCMRGLLDQFPQPIRDDLKELDADLEAGRISRHFTFCLQGAIPVSPGARIIVKLVREYIKETHGGSHAKN